MARRSGRESLVSRKMYEVRGLGIDEAFDVCVGVCDSLELANKIADRLNEAEAQHEAFWNEHASTCLCNCESWIRPDDGEAIESVRAMESFKCPFKKNIHIAEVVLENGKSGGFEMFCDGKKPTCSCPEYTNYVIEEVRVLTEEDRNI